jgi:hypothetical protein
MDERKTQLVEKASDRSETDLFKDKFPNAEELPLLSATLRKSASIKAVAQRNSIKPP